MRFKHEIIPIAAAAFVHLEYSHEAWDCLEDKENWLPEAGSELEESVYRAVFELRWGDNIDAGIWDRIVRMLEPYASDRSATHVFMCGLKVMEGGVEQALADVCIEGSAAWPGLKAEMQATGRFQVETY